MGDNKSPNILYHYTSLEGFYRIVTSNSINMNDVIKSNDPAEGKYTLQMMQYAYRKMAIDEEINESVYRRIHEAFTDFAEGENSFGRLQQVVMSLSFCEPHYPLALWRSYGNGGRGIAIGVSREKLEYIGSSPDFSFGQVAYYDETDMLEIYKLFWLNHLEDEGEKLIDSIREQYLKGYFIKRKENEYEREWRLIYTGINLENWTILSPDIPDEVDAYVKTDDIVLYYRLPIQKYDLIDYIYRGPRCKVTDNEMKWLLAKYHIKYYGTFKDDIVMR